MVKKAIVTGGSGFIGSFLVRELLRRGIEVVNLDTKEPVNREEFRLWRKISILNEQMVTEVFEQFEPDYVVHLAAVAIQDSKSLEDFKVNIQGTRNIINAVNKCAKVKKVIYTSTQYVNEPGISIPSALIDYKPYGYYGQSKLLGEIDVINLSLKANWTIIRPTAIWGPFHPVLTNGLWKQIQSGRYLHPTRDKCVKPYGYVENTVWQIAELLAKQYEETNEKTFYLADGHYLQESWVNMFVVKFGRKMRKIPRLFLLILSKIGDGLRYVGINFPLYTSRYRNLLQENQVPLDTTIQLLGPSPISTEQGVMTTVAWLKNQSSLRQSD